MRNNELVKAFLNGATEGKGSNLRIEGRKLINYSTVIAYKIKTKGILLNGQNYSPTTSRHQNQIRREFDKYGVYGYLYECDTEEDFNKNMREFESEGK